MRFLIVPLCLAWLAPSLPASDLPVPATGRSDPRLASIDTLMTTFLGEHDIPGASVAVARDGRVVYARGFGYADTDAGTVVQPGSLFRIASISKPITAVAILQLADRGKLKLNESMFDVLHLKEPAAKDAETFDARWKTITIDQLLYHTGGWDRAEAFDPMFVSPKIVDELQTPAPASPDAIIRYMLRRPLQSDPGSRYAYSNFGYCLLGRVIEKRGGEPYEKYVRENVLTPLGITSMKLGRTLLADRAKGEVKYYTAKRGATAKAVMGPELGRLVPWPYGGWCLESMDAHGGWIASASDLARFAEAFAEPSRCKILSEKAVKRLFEPPPAPVGVKEDGTAKARFYGRGWQVIAGDRGKPTYFHNGSLDGTSTLLVHRQDGFSWAILFNTRGGKVTPASAIDSLMHKAVDDVKQWPRGE